MLKITLSFDNGPSDTTRDVLDCLASHNIKTTFFVVGKELGSSRNSECARRAHQEGHWLGNHTFTHAKPLGELEARAALWEFEQTELALSWLDQPVRLFRPNGGRGRLGPNLLHPIVVDKLKSGGHSCVLWNCVPFDWEDPDGWVERVLADCRSRSWSLVVLHDIPTGAMSHLDEFIVRLKNESFEITQEFPNSCVPILKGKDISPIEPYLATALRGNT